MRRLNDDDGNVVMITALLATTLMGLAALTIDVGALYVRQSSLQTGADAAALAVARACAQTVVDTGTPCTAGGVTGLVDTYFDDNGLDSAAITTSMDELNVSWGGRAGRVTVRGEVTQPARFARAIGQPATQTVSTTATALWGPLTAVDAVYPLAVCKGALPAIGESFLLISDPADPTAYAGDCEGAPDEPSFGWLAPDDTALCTNKITLLPTTFLDVFGSDAWPTGGICPTALEDLHNDVGASGICHVHASRWRPPDHCHGGAATSDRQRDVVVYDAAEGAPGARPAHALISIEFTGTRFAGREETLNVGAGGNGWDDPVCEPPDPAVIDDLQCIEGVVRASVPPTDGPIVDPTVAALPTIPDSTVLDVRLVD